MIVDVTSQVDVPLEDCPFCGAKEADNLLEIREVFKGEFAIYCKTCRSNGPITASGYDAAEGWNVRA